MKLFIALQVRSLKRKNKILTFLVVIFCTFAINAQDADSLRIGYSYVNSFPQNAELYLNNENIGNTPLFFMISDSLKGSDLQIKLSLKGYSDCSETFIGNEKINRTYTLVPLPGTKLINPVKEDKKPYFERPRKLIPIVLSSLVTIGAGVSAFYFKNLATENRDNYDMYGDPSALDRKKKYDILSGVSLVVFQLGLGALVYYLLLE